MSKRRQSGLSQLIKQWERASETTLPPKAYTIVRVDGRHFHSYCRGLTKPYDIQFMHDMDLVAESLCSDYSGTLFAYTQSDEISLILADLQSEETQPMFGGRTQKLASVAASLAGATLTRARPDHPHVAMFDARAFTAHTLEDVARYYLWRSRDAVRNSILMKAQHELGKKQTENQNTIELVRALRDHGTPWEDLPEGFKSGRITRKVSQQEHVTYTRRGDTEPHEVWVERSHWETAPGLAVENLGEAISYLERLTPNIPHKRETNLDASSA